ncbi:hypothetical protein SAMN02910456_02579 [Ruminococcaceae bacterium YRB3002]|nr:hypothetical protein SAMN02910456_02579 [Ruminococcaceae bacterium YRB3002]
MTLAESNRFISDYYNNDNPSESDKALFIEAMLWRIDRYHYPEDMHNLAFFYLEQRDHDLELKYLEMAAEYDFPPAFEELGYIWYYGQTGEVCYEKAWEYFTRAAEGDFYDVRIWAEYKLADMYHNGYYVERDDARYRSMIIEIYEKITDPKIRYSYVLPVNEVMMRLAGIYAEEGRAEEALELLKEARRSLSEDIRSNPNWWGNIEIMGELVGLMHKLETEIPDMTRRQDIYDLYWMADQPCKVVFMYGSRRFSVDCAQEEDGIIIMFDGRWFRSVQDLLEKAVIDGRKLVYIYDELHGMEVYYE